MCIFLCWCCFVALHCKSHSWGYDYMRSPVSPPTKALNLWLPGDSDSDLEQANKVLWVCSVFCQMYTMLISHFRDGCEVRMWLYISAKCHTYVSCHSYCHRRRRRHALYVRSLSDALGYTFLMLYETRGEASKSLPFLSLALLWFYNEPIRDHIEVKGLPRTVTSSLSEASRTVW